MTRQWPTVSLHLRAVPRRAVRCQATQNHHNRRLRTRVQSSFWRRELPRKREVQLAPKLKRWWIQRTAALHRLQFLQMVHCRPSLLRNLALRNRRAGNRRSRGWRRQPPNSATRTYPRPWNSRRRRRNSASNFGGKPARKRKHRLRRGREHWRKHRSHLPLNRGRFRRRVGAVLRPLENGRRRRRHRRLRGALPGGMLWMRTSGERPSPAKSGRGGWT